MKFLRTDPIVYLTLVFLLIFTLVVGFVTRQTWLMPVTNALVLWPLLIWSLRHARLDVALRLIILWALVIFLFSMIFGRVEGPRASEAVPGSVEYHNNYIRWLAGASNDVGVVGAWLPSFARRVGVLLVGSIVTGGLVPLVVAARELAILGLSLSYLFNAASPLAVPLGIPPWVWAEMVGWVLLGVVLAEPIITGNVHALLTPYRRRLLVAGLSALLAAFVFHLLLAPLWQSLLGRLIFS